MDRKRRLTARSAASALGLAACAAVLSPVLSPVLAQTASAPLVLAPHRAVYDLTLLKAQGRDAPVSASGRIVYEFTGNACDGYTTNFRQITETSPAEGSPRVSDMRSSTHESGDGTTLRFRIEIQTNGQRTRLLEGNAERAGGTLSVAMRAPAPVKTDLPVDALFPVQQTFRGLAAARAGETTIELNVYDGSGDGTRVYHSLNIIGQEATKPADDATQSQAAMKGLKRWPVVASYFDRSQGDAKPIYVLSFEMWENGVSSNLRLDYGEFVLAGKLSQFEMLKPTPCEPGKR
ncbi:MAG: DUF1849 family protein [Alphaproteobacteria bacterium]|nr:DUF1849 family protein [Alphaproteobacteria bacterium]